MSKIKYRKVEYRGWEIWVLGSGFNRVMLARNDEDKVLAFEFDGNGTEAVLEKMLARIDAKLQPNLNFVQELARELEGLDESVVGSAP